jgi:chemotaxis protein histidine kinase CheA
MGTKHMALITKFRIEVENNLLLIAQGVVELEQNPSDLSIAGDLSSSTQLICEAARAMELADMARVAQAMAHVFDRMGQGQLTMNSDVGDLLFMGIEVLVAFTQIATKGSDTQTDQTLTEIDPDDLIRSLNALAAPEE